MKARRRISHRQRERIGHPRELFLPGAEGLSSVVGGIEGTLRERRRLPRLDVRTREPPRVDEAHQSSVSLASRTPRSSWITFSTSSPPFACGRDLGTGG